MILLTLQTPKGTKRSCDAKCYTAKNPTCHCICAGRNHGLKEAAAVNNTARANLTDIAHDNTNSEMPNVLRLYRPPLQLEMFA